MRASFLVADRGQDSLLLARRDTLDWGERFPTGWWRTSSRRRSLAMRLLYRFWGWDLTPLEVKR